MAICPKCKKVINHLHLSCSGIQESTFFINEDGVVVYEQDDFDSDGYDYDFKCSECWEVLFNDGIEAEDFLRDKDELKEIVAEKIGGNN